MSVLEEVPVLIQQEMTTYVNNYLKNTLDLETQLKKIHAAIDKLQDNIIKGTAPKDIRKSAKLSNVPKSLVDELPNLHAHEEALFKEFCTKICEGRIMAYEIAKQKVKADLSVRGTGHLFSELKNHFKCAEDIATLYVNQYVMLLQNKKVKDQAKSASTTVDSRSATARNTSTTTDNMQTDPTSAELCQRLSEMEKELRKLKQNKRSTNSSRDTSRNSRYSNDSSKSSNSYYSRNSSNSTPRNAQRRYRNNTSPRRSSRGRSRYRNNTPPRQSSRGRSRTPQHKRFHEHRHDQNYQQAAQRYDRHQKNDFGRGTSTTQKRYVPRREKSHSTERHESSFSNNTRHRGNYSYATAACPRRFTTRSERDRGNQQTTSGR